MKTASSRLVFTGIALVVLLGLVAFAVRGHATPGATGGHDRNASQLLANVVFTVWALAMAFGALLLIYVLAQRRRQRGDQRFRVRPYLTSLVIFALVFSSLVVLQKRLGGSVSRNGAQLPRVGKGLKSAEKKREATRPASPSFEWKLALAILALIAGIAATAIIRARRSRSEMMRELTLSKELTEFLDETLDDLRRETDPRKAVIAAYARMERILAAHDLPRRPAEAPLEYLARVLAELHVTEPSLRKLTALFERAKFSTHEIDVSMKEEAIEALEALRDDLRAIDQPFDAPQLRLDQVPRPAP